MHGQIGRKQLASSSAKLFPRKWHQWLLLSLIFMRVSVHRAACFSTCLSWISFMLHLLNGFLIYTFMWVDNHSYMQVILIRTDCRSSCWGTGWRWYCRCGLVKNIWRKPISIVYQALLPEMTSMIDSLLSSIFMRVRVRCGSSSRSRSIECAERFLGKVHISKHH